jgi:hypothetical protein
VKHPLASIVTQFDHPRYSRMAVALHGEFRSNTPYSHTVMDDFLSADVAEMLALSYPDPKDSTVRWKTHCNPNVVRQFVEDVSALPLPMRLFADAVISRQFLLFAEALSGIDRLMADLYFIGGAHGHGAGPVFKGACRFQLASQIANASTPEFPPLPQAIAESPTDSLGAELRQPTDYRGHREAQIKIFLMECIPTWLMASENGFEVLARDPFVLRSRIYKLPAAIVCDALKPSYALSGKQPQYKELFQIVSSRVKLFGLLIRVGTWVGIGSLRRAVDSLSSYWIKAGKA